MRPEEFDRILSTDDDIVPAAGFTASVMDRVRSEASTPAPIPFPWARALPGLAALVASAALAGWAGVEGLARAPVLPVSPDAWSALFARILDGAAANRATWIAAALLLTLATSMVSMRLASPRS